MFLTCDGVASGVNQQACPENRLKMREFREVEPGDLARMRASPLNFVSEGKQLA
jgi:hypothetical protein